MWEIEHGPINMLSRQGWTRTTLEPGDRVTVEVHPVHDGRPIGRFIDFKFTDERRQRRRGDYSRGTITRVPRPEPVPMSDAVARNFNGIWVNANGGIHFDTDAPSRGEQKPPLKPEYMARWRQRFGRRRAGLSTTDPTAACLPAGFPRFLNMVFPGEILQAEHQLNWYAEFGEATVRIYLDGRAPPAGSAAELLRLHDRTMGRQHAGDQDHRPARRHADRYDRHSAQRSTDRDHAVEKGHSGLPRGRRDARRSHRVRAAVVDREALRARAGPLLRAGVRVLRGQPLSDRRRRQRRNSVGRRPRGGNRFAATTR